MAFQTYRFNRTGLALALAALTLTQLGLLTHQNVAQAQAFTDDDVANYASAVFDIEVRRQEAYTTASDILVAAGSETDILEMTLSCQQTRMSDMPDIPRADRVDLRTVLVEYCNDASQLAEANDLTPDRFNSITAAHQGDPELAERIQTAISELQ
ncbi:MAG: DUF4168 domain-containing protein [Phormidesmis sp.]